MKKNTAFEKRIKVTKNGKLLARKPGQDHFNSRESREKQINEKHGYKNAGWLKQYNVFKRFGKK